MPIPAMLNIVMNCRDDLKCRETFHFSLFLWNITGFRSMSSCLSYPWSRLDSMTFYRDDFFNPWTYPTKSDPSDVFGLGNCVIFVDLTCELNEQALDGLRHRWHDHGPSAQYSH